MKRDRRNKKTDHRNKKVRLFLSLATAFFLFMAVVSLLKEGGILKIWEADKKLQTLKGDIVSLRKDNRRMEVGVMDLRNNGVSHINSIAREELGLVKPGETVYKFIKKK